jgi:hypothetical protein
MRLVDEPTEVDARFEADGQVRPRRFGRQWVDLDGRHVLVMAQVSHRQGSAKWMSTSRQTFELLLERESLTWRIVRMFDDVVAA